MIKNSWFFSKIYAVREIKTSGHDFCVEFYLVIKVSADPWVGMSVWRQRPTFPMLVLSAQTYLQFHKNFMSKSINIVMSTGTSKQAGLAVVNFLFRLRVFFFSSHFVFFLPILLACRLLCCLMDFIQFFFMPFVVMIAVCCQSHKNLNRSIKSPPTTALENIKSWRKYQTLCIYFSFDSTFWESANKTKESRLSSFKVIPDISTKET